MNSFIHKTHFKLSISSQQPFMYIQYVHTWHAYIHTYIHTNIHTYMHSFISINSCARLRRVRVGFGPKSPGGGQQRLRRKLRTAVRPRQEQLQHPSPGEEVPRAVSLEPRLWLHHHVRSRPLLWVWVKRWNTYVRTVLSYVRVYIYHLQIRRISGWVSLKKLAGRASGCI